MEADQKLDGQMKERPRKECKRGVKKILKSKLNGGIVITAKNTQAVLMMRYAAPFVDWRKDELKERLYLPRREGGGGLVTTEDCVQLAILGLENYVQDSIER